MLGKKKKEKKNNRTFLKLFYLQAPSCTILEEAHFCVLGGWGWWWKIVQEGGV
jgi:hypothetical protein